MASLVLLRGNGNPKALELGSSVVTLGRSLDCDLVVMHTMVSRRHAQLRRGARGWEVVDLGSANKVFVNDVLVESQVLRHGDIVRLGQEVELRYEAPEDAKPRVSLQPDASDSGALAVVSKVSDLRSDFAAPKAHETMLGLVSEFRKRSETEKALPASGRDSFHFFVLFQLARAINQAKSIRGLLEQALDLLVESLRAKAGAVLLIDPGTGELAPRVTLDKEAKEGPLHVSRTIADRAVRERVAVLTRDAAVDPRFKEGLSVAAMQIRSAVCCPIWDGDDVDGVIYLVASDSVVFGEADRDVVTAVGHQIAVAIRQEEMRKKLQQEATLRAHLMRYHSPAVVDMLVRSGAEGLAVRESEVTVLFADIEGFTPLSQRLPAPEIARILNGYFEATTEAIFAHHGQVNKYIGDAIMAVFGAPIANPNQAENACRAALDMIDALQGFRETLPAHERFRIRIAINSGSAVAGNIGASQRLEYTVIGNTVNVAARLEKLAPPDGIVVGPHTAERVRGLFRLRPLGPQQLRGLALPLEVFVLEGFA